MSKRTEKRLSNRRPYWTRRSVAAQTSGDAAAAIQYDLARANVYGIALRGDRNQQWRALAETLAEFNTRFVDPGEQPKSSGRLGEGERAFKARHNDVDTAAAQYDMARKYLRRMPDLQAESHWRELEKALIQFNRRFSDRTAV